MQAPQPLSGRYRQPQRRYCGQHRQILTLLGIMPATSNFRSQLTALTSEDAPTAAPRVIEVAGLTERPEWQQREHRREGLALGQAQLQFQTGIA